MEEAGTNDTRVFDGLFYELESFACRSSVVSGKMP
jgi:hypothetical protein